MRATVRGTERNKQRNQERERERERQIVGERDREWERERERERERWRRDDADTVTCTNSWPVLLFLQCSLGFLLELRYGFFAGPGDVALSIS